MRTKKIIILPIVIMLFLSATLSTIPLISATEIINNGFESGDWTGWTTHSGAVAITTVDKHSGSYSANITLTSGALINKQFTASNNVSTRVYFKFSTQPTTGNEADIIGLVHAGDTDVIRLWYANQGTYYYLKFWGYLHPSHTQETYGWNYNITLTPNVWNCFEIDYQMGIKSALYLNGSQIFNVDDSSTRHVDVVNYGPYWSGQAWGSTAWYDDAVITDNGYIGQNSFTISSNADSNSEITPSGSTTVYQDNSQSYNYSANEGYQLTDILVDGVSIDLETYPNNYTFNNVQANHNITVTSELTPTPTPTPPPVSQETDSTLNLVILLACLGLAILLMAWNKLPLLNFVFGIFIIGIAAYSLTINLYAGGLLQLAVIIIGVICMYSGYKEAV